MRRRQRLAELGSGLSCFEIDDEPLTAVDGERQLALCNTQRLARPRYRGTKFFRCSNHNPYRAGRSHIKRICARQILTER